MTEWTLMTKYRPNNGMLAGAELYLRQIAWQPQLVTKRSTYTFLILKARSKIYFESFICLAGKVTCKWK